LLARILMISILAAVIANGSVSWLKSVGWMNKTQYNALVLEHQAFLTRAREYMKNPGAFSNHDFQALKEQNRQLGPTIRSYLREIQGPLIFTKLLKYLVMLMLAAFGLAAIVRRENYLNKDRVLLGLVALVLVMTAVSGYRFGLQVMMPGIYGFLFLPIALTAGSIARPQNLQLLARFLALSLIILLLSCPVEYVRGIQYFSSGDWIHKRISGFLLQPNTMGIYAVCSFALIASLNQYKPISGFHVFWTVVTLALVMLSGSNTAAVAFVVFLGVTAIRRSKLTGFTTAMAFGLLVLALIAAITIIDRPIMDSAMGRLAKYQLYYTMDITSLTWLFGQGAGIASNTFLNFNSQFPVNPSHAIAVWISTDSTPLLLIIQVGMVGCLLFYALLIRAMIFDPLLRPVYLVFILCSLSINIIEVFPLNAVLGLMLAHSFYTRPGLRQKA